MTSKPKSLFLKQMSSVCADQSSLKARIAMISLFGPSSTPLLFEKALLLVEYLELLSPILLFALLFKQPQETFLPDSLKLLARLINPGLWMSFDELTGLGYMILSVLFLLTTLKYLLLFWIIYKFLYGFQPQNLVVKAWRTLFQVQGRVLYFTMTLFWVNMAMPTSLDDNLTEGTRKRSKVVVSLVAIGLEFGFSLLLYARHHYMLPLKSFLSSKDNVVEMITLVQKFVMQILTIFLTLNSESSTWVITVVNVIADVIRNFYFFKTLPLYNFKALDFQAMILMILTSVNLASFVSLIGKSLDSISLAFFICIWVLISILSVALAREYIKRMFWNIICNPSVKDPLLLLHRIPAIKELRSLTEEESESNEKNARTSLLNRTLNKNLKAILKINNGEGDINDKKSANVIFRSYLDCLKETFPRNKHIQLYAAKHSVKKYQKYGDTIKLIKAYQMNGSSNIQLNAELLLIQIQNKIQAQCAERNKSSHIDATFYLEEQALLAQLQVSMLEQASAQIKVCTEFKKDLVDTQIIHENSQIFSKLRGENLKKIDGLMRNLSESNLEPLLLYARYSLSLNHCYEDYSRYLKIYSQRLQKYQKYFDQEDLSHKNMFQENIGMYFLSADRADVGNIIFTFRALGTDCASQWTALSGTHMVNSMSSCLRKVYTQFYKNIAENNDETFFNKVTRGHFYHQDGYLVEMNYHLSIHPYVTQGFYFVLFLRPVISNRDAILILENGDIECGTKNVSEKLRFLEKKTSEKISKNLKEISEELAVVNKAFNMIAFPQKYKDDSTMTMEDAKAIYEVYTTTGKSLWLSPLDKSSGFSYSFHCKMVNRVFGPLLIKTLTLEENIKETQKLINEVAFEQLASSRHKTMTSERRYKTQLESEGCCLERDEKESGWIDFEAMTSKKTQNGFLTKGGDSCTETHEENATSRFLLRSPTSPLSETDHRKLLKRDVAKMTMQKKKLQTTLHRESENVKGKEKGGHYSEKASSLNESESRVSSQRKRLATVFRLSLEYKHYPSLFKVMSGLLYLALVVFLLGQFLIWAVVKSNVDDFKAQKDILRNFQLRNFYLITTEGVTRFLHDIQVGAFDISGVPVLANALGTYHTISRNYLSGLTEANQNLLLNSKYFDVEISSLLFTKDIPIYYTYFDESPQSYIEETSFGAVERIVTAITMVLNYEGTTAEAIQDVAHFVFRNCLNDVLVKNQKISGTIIGMLNSRRDKIGNDVTCYFIGMVVLNVIILVIFIFSLWKQYVKETTNLTAFCKISNQKVNEVLNECLEFKEIIEEQKSLNVDVMISTGLTQRKQNPDDQAKREVNKTPNHKGLRRKYYIYAGIFSVFLVLIVGLIVIGATLTGNLLDAFKKEQEQIYFVDYMRTRIALLLQASRELLATNNTAMLENRQAVDEYYYLLEELKGVKSQIYSKLLDEDTVEKIPDVETMLLGDACSLMGDSSQAQFYCQIMKNADTNTGLVYVLAYYEDALSNYLRSYEDSDKSESALMDIQTELYTEIPGYYGVLGNGAVTLSDIIDAKLEAQLESNNKSKIYSLIYCSVVAVIVGWLLWMLILRRLKEGVNQFKNVLKVLPAEVVLSSFLLKTFLRKTSKGGFDSFINQ